VYSFLEEIKGYNRTGCNVPVDAGAACSKLPRTSSSAGIFQVKLKRKKSFEGHVHYQNVRQEIIKFALQWLMQNIKHCKNSVEYDQNWESSFEGENEDIWKSLITENIDHVDNTSNTVSLTYMSEISEEEIVQLSGTVD
jgi:hypothetical protein